MSVARPDCPQLPGACTDRCCLCQVYADAKARCTAKGEGWRWGVGRRGAQASR